MVQENEIVMLILGLGVLVFVVANRTPLRRFQASGILMVGFYLLLAGWTLTVLEGFFWEGLLNYFEHTCYAIGSVLVALWCWRVFGGRKEAR